MTFSNPAGNASAAAGAYVSALLDLLGPRDPLEVMAELLPWLEARLSGISEPALRTPEAPGKWSVSHVVQHLADSDLVAGYRIRMVVAENSPPLQGYDQDRWAREFQYDQVPLDSARDQLRSLRIANLRLWSRLTPDQLQRVGIHSERGPESAGHILRLMGAHDLVHRRQIDRILASAH
ncbi:MAG TPA: DinB family protein [Gemmatimonadales bacterium]|nr:DinB family protein [Gemmatimonadales bacterium]